MRIFRYKQIVLVISILSLIFIICILKRKSKLNITKISTFTPIVIWWTPIISDYYRQRQCGITECIFTTKREFMKNSNIDKAFLFYGSDFNYTDLPLPRSFNDHIWALLHEESPKNVPYIQHEEILQHFNLTSTFSRFSNLPLTVQYLNDIDLLISQKYLVPIGEKNKLRVKQKLAPIVFIQSICDTMSGRDEYVSELMKYIEIDSFGKCLNNRKLPEELRTDYLQTIESDTFYRFLARYKFIMSYENSVCNDYITEKFWRPLIIGSVPIYFGAPNIKDWMPNEKSAILIKDFSSPKNLAKYLHYLNSNDTEYNKYLQHKYSQIKPITNVLLKKTILDREFTKNDNLFEIFECFVCNYLIKRRINQINNTIADQKHYNCGESNKIPSMTKFNGQLSRYNDWQSIMKYGKCQAKILNEFLINNKNFTGQQFQDKILKYIENGTCEL